jgi:hypothetical protein
MITFEPAIRELIHMLHDVRRSESQEGVIPPGASHGSNDEARDVVGLID